MNDNSDMALLATFLAESSALTDSALDALIPAAETEPQRLNAAMRWSIFAGGKRFRPALVIATGRTFGARDERLVRTAAAFEMVHSYSLIHDDLPSMDDDDLRRGRETCHIKFDEATAILAGDALQALAFSSIAEDALLSAEVRNRLVGELASAALKMVAGQQMDLEGEGRELSIDQIKEIHRNKTGALIRAAVRSGAIIGGADEAEMAIADEYGEKLGLLFQVTDDLLDVTATSAVLGKTAGKDAAVAKATYPGVLGIETATQHADEVFREASDAALKIRGGETLLVPLAEYIRGRAS